MYKLILILLLFSLNGCSNNSKSIIPETQENSSLPAHIAQNYQMVWNDEFNGIVVITGVKDLKKGGNKQLGI
jgi:hypothetical protein